MSLTLTDIPDDFGSGGRYLAPGGANGTPTLVTLLEEHKSTLEGIYNDNTGIALQKRSVVVGHADLSAAAVTQSINIGATLPANARIMGYDAHDFTAFAGGSVSALKLDIGTSGDVDAIVAQSEMFVAAVDGGPSTMPQGIRPNKLFAAAGAQLLAKFTATGDNLVNLTAGSVTIDVLFQVLA